MKAASAVQAAPNASWARRRQGFRTVAENARTDAAIRFRTQATASSGSGLASRGFVLRPPTILSQVEIMITLPTHLANPPLAS